MDKDFVFGLGCVPSVMDGTERVVNLGDSIEIPSSYSWEIVMPPVRNQGTASTCVCQSLTGVLDFFTNGRVGVSNVCNGYDIDELYSVRANKNVNGMTFKEAFDYLKKHGLGGEKIHGYARVNSVEAAKYALLMFGPIVCGLPVYNGAGEHFWEKIGRSMGGHAVTIVGYDENSFIIRNSWGEEWGDKGHTRIPFKDFIKNCFECWTVTL